MNKKICVGYGNIIAESAVSITQIGVTWLKKKVKCYIYTHVSTAMQIDGYSLEAQKTKMKAFCDYNEYEIAGEYEDAGKSGKSIEGRIAFNQMMDDIKSGKDEVSYVLVFKLSRFGRNAADVLATLQVMQDFGVNLICVEDGIDSSKDAGKLMISVLSAVAEIERENIRVQTMEGRMQKAREGKWNGGFAPYGYALIAAQAKKYEKVNRDKKEKIHLLSGILKCPVCGAGMYGNKAIKKRKDGSNYKDLYYYGCKHRNMTRGHKCDYKKQVHEEMLDASVAEVISKLVSNPKFSDLIRSKINMEVDTSALDQEIANYEKQLRQLYHNKDTILSDIDSLDYEDKHYQRRKTDLENRLYKTYDKIDEAEELLISAKTKKRALLADKITGDNIYKALIFFDKLYDKMNEAERREFLSQLVDNVQIYEERKENGQWLKSIEFKLPIIEKEFTLSLDNDTQNETVVLLPQLKQKPDDYIDVTIELDNVDITSAETKATYDEIKKYVAEHNAGMKVSNLYISQVKRKCGIEVGKNYNLPKNEDSRQPQCPEDKESAIVEALKYFKMIQSKKESDKSEFAGVIDENCRSYRKQKTIS